MSSERACHLVIIEDSEADVYLIQEALKDQDVRCDCSVFQSYESAIDAITSGRLTQVDGMLIDLNLRTGSGLDILRAVRQTEGLLQARTVIFTSSDDPRDEAAARELGADLYIRKPTGVDDFFAAIGRAGAYVISKFNGRTAST